MRDSPTHTVVAEIAEADKRARGQGAPSEQNGGQASVEYKRKGASERARIHISYGRSCCASAVFEIARSLARGDGMPKSAALPPPQLYICAQSARTRCRQPIAELRRRISELVPRCRHPRSDLFCLALSYTPCSRECAHHPYICVYIYIYMYTYTRMRARKPSYKCEDCFFLRAYVYNALARLRPR